MSGYVTAIGPTIGVLIIFWIVIRALVQADRRERIAQARIELAQRAADTRSSRSEDDPDTAGDS